jgi:hypothetical protein
VVGWDGTRAIRTEALATAVRKLVSIPLAVRVYPEPPEIKQPTRSDRVWRPPNMMLVFDTETRTDATQRLTFGSYRIFVRGRCLEEGLFFADDLPAKDRQILERYVTAHSPGTHEDSRRQLLLLTRGEFLSRFYKAVYKGRCLLVGFNLPFDLSRIAFNSSAARGRFAGGFSLGLFSYIDKLGIERENHFRPRVAIKRIDSKRALTGFTSRNEPDRIDLIPDASSTGEPKLGYKFRGNFLDLRTLAFALTDSGHSLESACEAFGVEHPKQHAAIHGQVSEDYIDYNRRDVLATSELATKLLEEFAKHPILLQPTKAYSPASIGKAYLHAMGIDPILQRQPNFPKQYLGYAQSAFYGGRASAHIRKQAVPVVYSDFLSMYPTVNSLMGLWQLVIAREIRIVTGCKTGIENFLRHLSVDALFDPKTWRKLNGFVQIIPDGDALPSRGKYNFQTNDWQVAVSHLYGDKNPTKALWFSLPDVAASVLLTGRVPTILDAFSFKANGVLPTLRPTALGGLVKINPKRQDFFKVVIEERKRLSERTDLSEVDRKRLDKALKVLANASSYGIYAEMHRQETDEKVWVTCHGIDSTPFRPHVAHPDTPGEYCFPPLASLITGGARLMLALLEHRLSELGGTYAMEDTDSMAIVATEQGALVPCRGGEHRTPNGQEAIKAVSWADIVRISQEFAALNPYDPEAVPGSILKIETDNFDPKTLKQRQIDCVAISAKRYALFVKDTNGRPVLLRAGTTNKEDRWSEHGLGHLLNPTDPESDDREWIAQIWLNIVVRTLGFPTKTLQFKQLPAVGRTTISSPALMKPFTKLNEGKKYADQIKPFNFLITCHISPLGHPLHVTPEQFHLIAPYELNPAKWLNADWIDQYTGKPYRITTAGHHGGVNVARVKTYGEVALEYAFHPESKCADAEGKPCGKQTIGLLQRRHVQIDYIKYIGKESNSLEEVESGLIHSEKNVYTEYTDPRRDEWTTKILPALKRVPLSVLVKACSAFLRRRAIIDLRAGRSRPHRKNRELLFEILRKLGVQ